MTFIIEIFRSFFALIAIFVLIFLRTHADSTEEDSTPKLNECIKEASMLLDAGLYDQAIRIYREMLKNLTFDPELSTAENKALQVQVRFYLAKAFFEMENYVEALPLLEENCQEKLSSDQKDDSWCHNSLYLAALVYKNRQEYALAKEALIEYLNSNDQLRPDYYEEAHLELGLIHFLWNKLEEAQNCFKFCKDQLTQSQLKTLAQMYLARIELAKNNYLDALAFLMELDKQIPENDVLRFELTYLKGEILFQLNDFDKAVDLFEQSLPKIHPEKCPWYRDTLFHLGWGHLKIGEDPHKSPEIQQHHYSKAEEAFQKLLKIEPQEQNYLALGQCYLSKASRFKEEKAYAMAENLLSRQEVFISSEAQGQALLLRAKAAPTYALRDKFYRQLTQDANNDNPFYANGWYLRALNDFEEGQTLLQAGRQEEGISLLERSASNFKKAFELLKESEKAKAGEALKYQALAISFRNTDEANLKAFLILQELFDNFPGILKAIESLDEIYYLHGFFGIRLGESDQKDKLISLAEHSLKKAAEFPNGKFGDIALRHLGTLQYRQEKYESAEKIYLQLAKEHSNSPFAAEAWFWAANCADKLGNPEIGKQRRRYAFENFPQEAYADEAYFTFYSYREYMQGDRNAIKHLQLFTEKYSETPLLIQAYYLIGLDNKRERKTPEGKWIRKKNLIEAIDAFQKVETLFDSYTKNALIQPDKLEYYTKIYYRAILERAIANFNIAEESQGAKQQIYFEYAESVFKSLYEDFSLGFDSRIKLLLENDPFPTLFEECSFWLARTYIKTKNDLGARQVLLDMLQRYKQAKITRGYYLSRAWYELGKIAASHHEEEAAFQFFKSAEDAGKGNILGTDQRLDILLQQSMCCRKLNRFDDAILLLSRVINDDAVSTLRLQAMYLRAEVYEQQGRPELARKQLESMVKKGGTWAIKAKEKLEKEYGY